MNRKTGIRAAGAVVTASLLGLASGTASGAGVLDHVSELDGRACENGVVTAGEMPSVSFTVGDTMPWGEGGEIQAGDTATVALTGIYFELGDSDAPLSVDQVASETCLVRCEATLEVSRDGTVIGSGPITFDIDRRGGYPQLNVVAVGSDGQTPGEVGLTLPGQPTLAVNLTTTTNAVREGVQEVDPAAFDPTGRLSYQFTDSAATLAAGPFGFGDALVIAALSACEGSCAGMATPETEVTLADGRAFLIEVMTPDS